MTEIDRREFIKRIAIVGTGAVVAATGLAVVLRPDELESSGQNEAIAALRVSSDIYATQLDQRFAFTIFNSQSEVISEGPIDITLTSPTNKIQKFPNTKIRNKGLDEQGIYSVAAKIDEPGSWLMETTFKGEKLDLAFSASETNVAPGLGTKAPDIVTPTKQAPLDATVLCTNFDGDCELHDHSVSDLLKTSSPFVVLFATPARCKTSYCGPVLELTRNVAKRSSLPVVHVEIYKNETSNDLLDAVSSWGLVTEPWMFGINSQGMIDSRLDGAFDQSEVEELFKKLS